MAEFRPNHTMSPLPDLPERPGWPELAAVLQPGAPGTPRSRVRQTPRSRRGNRAGRRRGSRRPRMRRQMPLASGTTKRFPRPAPARCREANCRAAGGQGDQAVENPGRCVEPWCPRRSVGSRVRHRGEDGPRRQRRHGRLHEDDEQRHLRRRRDDNRQPCGGGHHRGPRDTQAVIRPRVEKAQNPDAKRTGGGARAAEHRRRGRGHPRRRDDGGFSEGGRVTAGGPGDRYDAVVTRRFSFEVHAASNQVDGGVDDRDCRHHRLRKPKPVVEPIQVRLLVHHDLFEHRVVERVEQLA